MATEDKAAPVADPTDPREALKKDKAAAKKAPADSVLLMIKHGSYLYAGGTAHPEDLVEVSQAEAEKLVALKVAKPA